MSQETAVMSEEDQKREEALRRLEPKPIDPKSVPLVEAVIEKKPAVKPKTKTKGVIVVPPALMKSSRSQFLDLGEGFKIAHKPGSAYSVLYKVVAENGNFASVVKELEEGVDLSKDGEAQRILNKMMVPVSELEALCRNESAWKDHAAHKTDILKKQSSDILKSESRATKGAWSGNISEMVSTCVGSYAAFLNHSKGNKNINKFKDAGVLFRRFPMKRNDECYVMMYPEKFEKIVKAAIKKAYGKDSE